MVTDHSLPSVYVIDQPYRILALVTRKFVRNGGGYGPAIRWDIHLSFPSFSVLFRLFEYRRDFLALLVDQLKLSIVEILQQRLTIAVDVSELERCLLHL